MGDDGFVDISAEKDGGLLKKILVEGSGDEVPTPGSHVSVHYVGTLHADGSKFDSSRDRDQQFKFDVGVGQVIQGWDAGICTMKKGEKCILRVGSDYGYGDDGSPPKIPGGATLNFEVELFSWKEKVEEPYKMSASQRSEYASKMKEQGNAAFKAQDFAGAVEAYSEGHRYITCNQDDDGDSEQLGGDEQPLSDEDKALAVALLTNCAMVRLKAGVPECAISDCSKALKLDATNVKAYFRRAGAKLAMGDFDAAAEDARKAIELDPSNKEAEQLARRAEHAKKAQKQKEKAMCSKMFG